MALSFEKYKKKYPNDIPIDFTEEDYNTMVEQNPYRPSSWWFPTGHEGINRIYIFGWVKGRYRVLNHLVDIIKRDYPEKGWSLDREKLRKIFAEITQAPDFGLPKQKNDAKADNPRGESGV